MTYAELNAALEELEAQNLSSEEYNECRAELYRQYRLAKKMR